MYLPEGFIEELKSTVPLSKIIQHRVKLLRKGTNFIGLCPFHNEKTPSFNVVDPEGYYHCFGCGAHGDLITFIRNTENLSFMEAVEKIAKISGIMIPNNNFKSFSHKENSKRESQLSILKIATSYFQDNLYTENGKRALEYLYSRGLNDIIIKEFKIGFAPDKGLKEKINLDGISDNQLIDVGLIRTLDQNHKTEVFKNRIIFPIFNSKSDVIGFGSRSIYNSKVKYINSPNTELFQKSKILYGFPQAIKLRKVNLEAPLLIVEGYMDVISIFRFGLASSLASLGTALNNYQIKLIWKLNKKPILCFDNDSAGRNAALRVIKNVLPILEIDYEINILFLPETKDPDDMIRDGMIDDFKNLISNPKTLVKSMWELLSYKYDVNNPDERASFWSETKNLIRSIKDQNLKESYLYEINLLIKLMKTNNLNYFNYKKNNIVVPTLSGKNENLKAILFILINYPNLYKDYSEDLVELEIKDENLKNFLNECIIFFNKTQDLEKDGLMNHLKNRSLGKMINEISSKSVIRRINFNKSDAGNFNEIEENFKNILKHAVEISRRNKKFF